MTVLNIIEEKFQEVLERRGLELEVDALSESVVLLQSGMDSLGFAMLVALLDEELGYDPFTLMAEPVYPQTFGEFVAVYQKFAPAA